MENKGPTGKNICNGIKSDNPSMPSDSFKF